MQALLVALVLLQTPEETIFSGPQKGEEITGFRVLALNGPDAEKRVDYITRWKGANTAICFVHELTRPGARVMRLLDRYGTRHAGNLKTLFVFLTDDPHAGEKRFPAPMRSLQMKTLAGVSLDGLEGPGAYGLNKEVTLTVLLAKRNRVTANYAIVSPNETDFPRIQKELDRLTAPPLETPEEMRAEILRLRAAVDALRAELQEIRLQNERQQMGSSRMRRPTRGGERAQTTTPPAARSLPGKRPEDPGLESLIRRLILNDATNADIDAVIREIEGHVKSSADLQAQLIGGLDLVDHLKYGTEYSRRARQSLRAKFKKD